MLCRNCGKEFEPKKRGRKNTGFCCKHCADGYRVKNKEPRYEKVCEWCGKNYRTNSVNQKYCSTECRGLASQGRTIYVKECIFCGSEFETSNRNRKYCSPACAARHHADQIRGEYICEYCGKPQKSDHPNRNRFCSVECAQKARNIKMMPLKQAKKKEHKILSRKVCPTCGNSFMAKHRNHICCSKECYAEYRDDEQRRQWQEQYQAKEFVCVECGRKVVTQFGDSHRVYCSAECMNRAVNRKHKHRRKEQLAKAYVEPVSLREVYLRAKGVCEICGLPVPMTNEPTNQWAATRDHIIPISKAGLHEKRNVQLAHRLCNSLKQDTTEEFSIDWEQKLKDEPGRWNEQLDALWKQLDCEIHSKGVV